jgi:dolichyl-phosphate beta-glucosyltransferase
VIPSERSAEAEIELTVVVPTYNEESRIPGTLAEMLRFIAAKPYRCEILICDDGSLDGTVELARSMLGEGPHRVLTNPVNRGKGSAVRRGMLEGRGRFLLFSDADLSTPIEETDRFLDLLRNGHDVVIGSRALAGARLEVRQEFYREWMGKVFNRIARLLTFHGISDSQCGFKAFRREAARDLFSRQRIDGFSFDAEILFLAQRRSYRIKELAVTWRHSPATRVSLCADPFKMFLDLVRIAWIHRHESPAETHETDRGRA